MSSYIVFFWHFFRAFKLGSFYCFLFCPKIVTKTTRTKVMQKSWCSKSLKYYSKKDRSQNASYCFLFHILVSYLSLWNYSDSFLRYSTSYVDPQNYCCFNKKRQIRRRFLLFLVPDIRFLLESQKLIKQFSSRFDEISGCVLFKRVEILEHFPKNFAQLKIFLVPRHFFLFFNLASKELVFLNKTNYFSCSKWLRYYINPF